MITDVQDFVTILDDHLDAHRPLLTVGARRSQARSGRAGPRPLRSRSDTATHTDPCGRDSSEKLGLLGLELLVRDDTLIAQRGELCELVREGTWRRRSRADAACAWCAASIACSRQPTKNATDSGSVLGRPNLASSL